MNFKKVVMTAMGVVASVCIANADTFSNLTVNGASNLKSTLNVTGVSTLKSSLNVSGTTTLSGNFSGLGSSNYFENGLTIYTGKMSGRSALRIANDGNGLCLASMGYHDYSSMQILASTFTLDGIQGQKHIEILTGGSIGLGGKASSSYKLQVNGTSNFTNNVSMAKNLTVTGKILCKSEIEVADLNAGAIKAKDINVELNNAADYVFDENYELKSLGEVESYVKANKHLPGVPSASEIAKNGMSVSEMSNILLEKVEELTLHLIQLEKENKMLKEEVNELKNR